ncbi:MAG TPA: SPOR domain-containing protein [Spirochaetia bacterium]|jgi:DedD protein|nr:SPOR domain-containing protein [Spirochaetia bacterium]
MKYSKGMIALFIALAALSVIVAVGLIFFLPKEPAKAAAVPSPTPAPGLTGPANPVPDQFDPVEWTRNPQATAGQVPESKTTTDSQGFTVTLPADKTATAVPTPPPGPGVSFPGEATPTPNPNTVESTPVTPTAPAKVPAPKAKTPAVAKTPAAKPAPKPTTGWWIQVASFKDRYQAENTAKALEAQGLKGTLTTATVNGQTVVRVRVGPYANEAEASKFLAWLKPVKEFEASYITKVGLK